MNKQAQQTHVIEGKDGSVKITHPPGNRKHPHVTVLLDSDDIVREQVGGFVNFLREYAVVGLAVGFIIGLQAQTLMKQLVDSFITPMLSVWLGKDLINRQFTIGTGSNAVAFTWGKFIYALVSFIFVVFFIYLIVKLFKLDKFSKPKKAKK